MNGPNPNKDKKSLAPKRRVSVLGATGTVGKHTCDLIKQYPDLYKVVALTANSNIDALVAVALELEPEFVALADPGLEAELVRRLKGSGIQSGAGDQAVLEAGRRSADWIMASIVGAAGLAPTLAAVRQGTTVAVANKECLVTAGAVFMAQARLHGTTILPVDSEHSAVFQCLDTLDGKGVEKIILTASGGPFRTWSFEQIKHAKLEDALKHPNYTMGQKITIDSATLMNKGLELIEAHHLFGLHADKFEAIVHPQQILHCMVYYTDGSVIAQASMPDMRTPIAYALGWPERLEADFLRADFARIGTLTFEAPDEHRFPALRLAREAMQAGGIAPTVLNAANEVAVESFLNRDIDFMTIPAVVAETLDLAGRSLAGMSPHSLDDVLHVDHAARQVASQIIAKAASIH